MHKDILVIDDNPDIRFLICNILKEQNFNVRSAANYDQAVLEINKKSPNFHARFSAKERVYKYIIYNRSSKLSLNNLRGWHIKKKLDINLMKIGGQKLTGTKNFGTYRASNCGSKSPIKTLKSVKIKTKREKIEIYFKSKSFLKQQVRSMVGCLNYLSQKKWNVKTFKKIFKLKKRSMCAPPAPARLASAWRGDRVCPIGLSNRLGAPEAEAGALELQAQEREREREREKRK